MINTPYLYFIGIRTYLKVKPGSIRPKKSLNRRKLPRQRKRLPLQRRLLLRFQLKLSLQRRSKPLLQPKKTRKRNLKRLLRSLSRKRSQSFKRLKKLKKRRKPLRPTFHSQPELERMTWISKKLREEFQSHKLKEPKNPRKIDMILQAVNMLIQTLVRTKNGSRTKRGMLPKRRRRSNRSKKNWKKRGKRSSFRRMLKLLLPKKLKLRNKLLLIEHMAIKEYLTIHLKRQMFRRTSTVTTYFSTSVILFMIKEDGMSKHISQSILHPRRRRYGHIGMVRTMSLKPTIRQRISKQRRLSI